MKTIKKIKYALLIMPMTLFVLSCSKDDNGNQIERNGTLQAQIDLGTHTLETYSSINQSEYLVVFESGLGDGHSVWFEKNILAEIGKVMDVLLYDRAGYENSEIGPDPRDVERLSEELDKVISKYSNGQKIILVSHSLGGIIARDFAIKHPTKISALLFIDPSHESFNSMGQEEEDKIYDMYRETYGENHGATREVRVLIENLTYAATLPNLPDVPVIVLTSMKEDGTNNNSEGAKQKWYNAHEELGEGITDFTHISTLNSGHYIMIEEPKLVIESIQTLVSK